MWKAILFTIGAILAFSVVGFVVYTLVAGTGTSQCVLDSDCPEGQSCLTCNGTPSCQNTCPSGKTWDSSKCECTDVTTVNWSCNSSTLPQCQQDTSCDPSTDVGCYTGLDDCITGCMYGGFNGTKYYLYDPDTNKSDMIMYIFDSYPGDNLTANRSIMTLCDGTSPPATETDDDRGVFAAFEAARLGSAPTVSCDDLCDDSQQASRRLGADNNHYYFQNLSSRKVFVDFWAKDNASNRITQTMDGSKSCGRKPCLGKHSDSSDFEFYYITVDGKKLYLSDGKKKITSANGSTREHIRNNYTCVFVDISCQKLAL